MIEIDPYNVTFRGHKLDTYRVALAFGVTDPCLYQALKKILRCGQKHKTAEQDVDQAITSLEEWKLIRQEEIDYQKLPEPFSLANVLDAGFEAARVENVAIAEGHPTCPKCGRAVMAGEAARGFCYCGGPL